MCLEKYLNRLKGDFNYVLINIEIEGMMQKKKLECEFAFVWNTKIGSFSNDDGDGNEDVKKAIGLSSKTTTLHVHHAFLYISLPSLHDYEVKMSNCKVYGGRKQPTTNLFFSKL